MSLKLIEGFDDGLFPQRWPLSINAGTSGTNRNGGLSCRIPNTVTTNHATYQVAAADEHATFIVGAAVLFTSGSQASSTGAAAIFQFMSDAQATCHLTLFLNADASLSVKRGTASGTVMATSAANVVSQLGLWQYIEMKATLHDTTGSVEVRVNGVAVISLSGVDTKNAGTKTVFDTLRLGVLASSTGHDQFYDDLYLATGDGTGVHDFLGDVAVETLLPNGDGTTNQFVGSDGNSVSNWQLVDDASMADYVEDGTLNDIDLYAMTDLVRTTGTVFGVQVSALAMKSDSGTRGMKPIVKSSSTTVEGTELTLTTTQAVTTSMVENDPATSSAWTISGVNAVQTGVKVST